MYIFKKIMLGTLKVMVMRDLWDDIQIMAIYYINFISVNGQTNKHIF